MKKKSNLDQVNKKIFSLIFDSYYLFNKFKQTRFIQGNPYNVTFQKINVKKKNEKKKKFNELRL